MRPTVSPDHSIGAATSHVLHGHATGGVGVILRLEAALVGVVAIIAYHQLEASWMTFAVLFLVPDVSIAGYLIGRSVGAVLYNTAHSYLLPLMLLSMGMMLGWDTLYPFALIWLAHIGVDRMLGFGLKYRSAFTATHLGVFGTGSTGAVE